MTLADKITLVLVAAAFVAATVTAFNFGYDRAENKYLAEQAAMVKANNTAIAKAQEALEADLTQVKAENERLDNAYAQVIQGARADARAGECGVSSGSVQRLNSLR
jgi:F0F1-type ATP synthase membrane subunit b/b'